MRALLPVSLLLVTLSACGGGDDTTTPPGPPSVSIAATASVTEGNSGTTMVSVRVTLSGPSAMPVTVAYATADGTATAAADYTAVADQLTFAPGSTTRTIEVAVAGDVLDEADETFTITLAQPSGATIAAGTATVTITDDDAAPRLAVAAAVAVESSPDGLRFPVTLSAPSSLPVMVAYATADGTATAADYTSTSGMLLFMPGETTATVAVPILPDTVDEPDETLTLALSDAMNATIETERATGTITDDDLPTVSIVPTATILEGNTGAVNVMLAVTLSGPSATPVTVDYATADGTATAPADYTAAAATLSFAAGTVTKTITVAVKGDALDEDDETLTVTLRNPQGATIANATATITITDDDAMPVLSVAPVTAAEGSATGLRFTVTLTPASGRAVMVGVATADGTATAPADYAARMDVVTFAPGQTTRTVDVALVNDVNDELDETLTLALSAPVNATTTMNTDHATGTITDDDPLPVLAVAPASALEDSAAGLRFDVTLTPASGKPVMVAYATSNRTATSPGDYTPAMGTLAFMPGETTKPVPVALVADVIDEPDETLRLTLSGPTNATIGTAQADGTIIDDDGLPTVSIAAAATLLEGNAGTTTGTVDVTLSPPSGVPVTVTYEVTDGTATTPADYLDASGTLVFPAGTATLSIPIDVAGDLLDEDDETLTVTLTSAQGATLGAARTALVTIADDDALPALAVAPITAAEGYPRGLELAVTLSTPSSRTITVDYATAGGSAGAGDYTGVAGTLDFLPGETSRTVTVAIANDALDEGDETVQLHLSAPVNAVILTADAVGTITDDDPTPTISISDAVGREDTAGTLSFAVVLSAVSGRDVSVMYGTTGGTAAAGVDYATTAGTLVIPAGAIAGAIEVPVNGDADVEGDESFTITLSAPSGATISGAPTTTGTISDDDGGLPTVSIADATVDEGNAGTTAMTFAVTLDAASAGAVTVGFATAPVSASDGPEVGGGDFVPLAGTVTFAPGETARTITVQVAGDVADEAAEAFRVDLAGASGALIGRARAFGTIVDDDAAPSLSVTPVTVGENVAVAAFTVELSAASGQTVTVAYATADGTAIAGGHARTGGEDYVARAGTLTFRPGETSKSVAVTIAGDVLDEADETFALALADPVGATIAVAGADATITDDDATPSLAIADGWLLERATVTSVPVTLSAPSGRPVTVNYATGAAPAPTATAGDDYLPAAGTLTFPPGVTTRWIDVEVLADVVDEPAERLAITLSGASPTAIIADAQGLVTIGNDDSALPGISIGNPSVVEGAGSVTLTFAVSLGAPSATQVTVSYATTALGTATAGTDFTTTSGVVTFLAGQTSKTVAVTVPADAADEAAETVIVALSGASANANLLDAFAVGTILDNDATPTVSVNGVSLGEGNAATTATLTILLSAVSGQPVTVAYTTRDATASAASGLGLDDYETRSGVAVIPAGTGSVQVTVPIIGDRILEPNETFSFVLSAPVNAAIGNGNATVTITNDDLTPSLSIGTAQVVEGPPGLRPSLLFPVTLTAPSLVPVSATFNTANGTAGGADYVAVPATTFTIPPGVTVVYRPVLVLGDAVTETDETVTGRISAAINATIAAGTVNGLILDDD